MKRLFRSAPTLLLLGGAAAVAVFAYNAWSFCCGRCSAATFLNPGPPGFILLGANFLAILAFIAVRRHRREAERYRHCGCGALLRSHWLYCPDCGSPIGR